MFIFSLMVHSGTSGPYSTSSLFMLRAIPAEKVLPKAGNVGTGRFMPNPHAKCIFRALTFAF